jgi:hypothetical protein
MNGNSQTDRGRQPDRSAQEFDYGVGDEVDTARQQIRTTIARQIRRAAERDPMASHQVKLAYELAAQIAEGRQATAPTR